MGSLKPPTVVVAVTFCSCSSALRSTQSSAPEVVDGMAPICPFLSILTACIYAFLSVKITALLKLNKVGAAACGSKTQTHETGSGAKGKRFIQMPTWENGGPPSQRPSPFLVL